MVDEVKALLWNWSIARLKCSPYLLNGIGTKRIVFGGNDDGLVLWSSVYFFCSGVYQFLWTCGVWGLFSAAAGRQSGSVQAADQLGFFGRSV